MDEIEIQGKRKRTIVDRDEKVKEYCNEEIREERERRKDKKIIEVR